MTFDRFLDARQIPSGTELSADVCIAGAGAAGITIARELTRSGISVCLLEAGGLSQDPAVNALSVVENAGLAYSAETTRLRQFGGTTNHWGGHCVPLSPEDFAPRDWIGNSAHGWPYSFDDLRPYYAAAHEALGIGEFDYRPETIAAELGGVKLLPFSGTAVVNTVSRYNRVRFGLTFGDELNNSPQLQCVLYADLSAIDLADPEQGLVSQVRVRSVAQNEFVVKARHFVIACGGIENARILLASNHQRAAGLGNHSGLAGRYFMEHIWYEAGIIVPREPMANFAHYCAEVPFHDFRARFHVAIPVQEQKRLRIPAFRAELQPMSEAFFHVRELVRKGINASSVATLLTQPYDLGIAVRCQRRSPRDVLVLGNYVEQTPNPESRVTLSETRDAIGRLNARLTWKITSQDAEGIRKAHQQLAQELGRIGAGRMQIGLRDLHELELGAKGGAHHMGTTRMHRDAKFGVTDEQGRVHSTANLFVAGSSLFPNCGYANPTLTIVATSIRMADAIKRELGRPTRHLNQPLPKEQT